MASNEIEICSNCGREIQRSEQAFLFKFEVVCAECDRKLRSGIEPLAGNLPESELFSHGTSSTFEGRENATDEDISEVLGLDGLEVAGAREKETKGDSQVYKCYVCGQRCPWDPVLKANYNPICKRCSEEQQEQQIKREMEISRQRKAERKWGILGGLGLYLLGVGLTILAVWLFFMGHGSFLGTTTAIAVFLALAVPCFKVGTEFLRGAGLLPW